VEKGGGALEKCKRKIPENERQTSIGEESKGGKNARGSTGNTLLPKNLRGQRIVKDRNGSLEKEGERQQTSKKEPAKQRIESEKNVFSLKNRGCLGKKGEV